MKTARIIRMFLIVLGLLTFALAAVFSGMAAKVLVAVGFFFILPGGLIWCAEGFFGTNTSWRWDKRKR